MYIRQVIVHQTINLDIGIIVHVTEPVVSLRNFHELVRQYGNGRAWVRRYRREIRNVTLLFINEWRRMRRVKGIIGLRIVFKNLAHISFANKGPAAICIRSTLDRKEYRPRAIRAAMHAFTHGNAIRRPFIQIKVFNDGQAAKVEGQQVGGCEA